MAIDYVALKNEFLTDPTGLGYAAPRAAGNHTELARLINQVQGTISVYRGMIGSWELLACVNPTEYSALTADNKQLLQIVLACVTVDTTDSGLRAIVASVFGPATATRAAMIARASRSGSRAEQLFGTNTVITTSDVAIALKS